MKPQIQPDLTAVTIADQKDANIYVSATRSPRESKTLEYFGMDSHIVSRKQPQFLAAGIASLGALAIGSVVSWSSPALPELQKSETFSTLTSQELTWIASLVPLGAILGAPIAGFCVERLGRQRSMFLLCIPFILGWLSIVFAQHVAMIYVGRFITGSCGGALCLLIPIYISETAEESIRGTASAPFGILIGVGILLTYLIGSYVSWQTLTLIHTVVPIVFMIGLYFIPETPVYLLEKGMKKRAGKSLMWLRGAHTFDQIQSELTEMQVKLENNNRGNFQLRHLVALEALRPTIVSLVLMFLQQFAGINAVIFYAAKIFKDAGSDMDPQSSSIIVAAVLLIGLLLSSVFIDKAGRKLLILISCVGSCVSLIGLGTYFYLKAANGDASPENLGWLPLASLIIFALSFNFGLGPIPWIYMAEILPSHIKGSASAISTSFNWTLAFLVTKTFEDLTIALGTHGCYWMFAGVCGFGAVYTYFCVPETKGKSLDEIQKYFKSSRN